MKIENNKKSKHSVYNSVFMIDWKKISLLLKEKYFTTLKENELYSPNYLRDVFFNVRANRELLFILKLAINEEIKKLSSVDNL